MTLAELLADRAVLLADGATGTNLFDMGLTSGDAPDMWNLEKPENVRNLHRGFVDAGSDIILTNTFGANARRLMLHKAEDQAFELNKAGAELAREIADAAGRPVIVAGWAVYALVYLGMAVVGRGWQFYALIAAYGVYYGLTEGVARALVADFVDSPLRGTAYGVYHAALEFRIVCSGMATRCALRDRLTLNINTELPCSPFEIISLEELLHDESFPLLCENEYIVSL